MRKAAAEGGEGHARISEAEKDFTSQVSCPAAWMSEQAIHNALVKQAPAQLPACTCRVVEQLDRHALQAEHPAASGAVLLP